MNHAGEATPVGFPVDTPSVKDFSGAVSTPRRKALAIVGSHPATRELAPYDNPDIEIWLFNEAPMKPEVYRRWDACIQIHGPEVYASPNNWVNMGYWEWLQQSRGKTIYMQEVDPRVPDSVRYPLEGILKLIPYRYLRSSPAMALALAIYLGYEHIELYGSELTSNTEYTYQAVNYAFWIGLAHGRGVDLELHCWQNEFNQLIYGYNGELQLDREFFGERVAENESIRQNNQRAFEKIKKQLSNEIYENKFQKVAGLSIEIENAALAVGELEGIVSEAKRYHAKEAMISRQEFERVAAQAQKDGEELREQKIHKGGICEYLWNTWKQTGMIEARDQLRQFLGEKTQLAYDCGVKHGVFTENMNYLNEYDKRLNAAGGVRALGRLDEIEKLRVKE